MTGCDRILAVLSDREWHDTRELYQLGTVAHSRISDLRKRGHKVEYRRNGDAHEYRLVLSGPGPSPSPLPLPKDGSDEGPGAENTTLVRDRVDQLILFGVAA